MSVAAEPAGTLEVALNHATQLLRKDPTLAAEQAEEILRVVPGHPHARLILGAARRAAGQHQAALDILESLALEQAPIDAGISGIRAGPRPGRTAPERRSPRCAMRCVCRRNPRMPGACWPTNWISWRTVPARIRPERATSRPPTRIPDCWKPAQRWSRTTCRSRCASSRSPGGASEGCGGTAHAGEVAGRLRRYTDAQALLERCLELAPSFDAARLNYAQVLNRQAKSAAGVEPVERLLSRSRRTRRTAICKRRFWRRWETTRSPSRCTNRCSRSFRASLGFG